MRRALTSWGVAVATAQLLVACASPPLPASPQPPANESSRGASTPTTTSDPASTTPPSTGPSSPASVTPRFLERAPDGCDYTLEYWPPVPGYVSARVAMPERPGQTDDEQPAKDHLDANDKFTAYAEMVCSGVTYVVIAPYKWADGVVKEPGLVRKTDAIKLAQAPPTSI